MRFPRIGVRIAGLLLVTAEQCSVELGTFFPFAVGRVGCFHLGVIMNNASLCTHFVCIFVSPVCVCPAAELSGPILSVCSTLSGTARLSCHLQVFVSTNVFASFGRVCLGVDLLGHTRPLC